MQAGGRQPTAGCLEQLAAIVAILAAGEALTTRRGQTTRPTRDALKLSSRPGEDLALSSAGDRRWTCPQRPCIPRRQTAPKRPLPACRRARAVQDARGNRRNPVALLWVSCGPVRVVNIKISGHGGTSRQPEHPGQFEQSRRENQIMTLGKSGRGTPAPPTKEEP